MKVLGVIPARGGSKGVPRKNIKLLNGKPLIQYTIESAHQSKLLDTVILSSEDEEIIRIAKKLNIEVPFVRPSSLSLDNSPTLSVLKHALEFYLQRGIKFDAVCLMQVTSPFRKDQLIDDAIKKFKETKADSLISVLRIPHEYNPHWAFEEREEGVLKIATGEDKIITRRQDLPKSFFRDGSIYITKSEVILNQSSLYGNKISYIENDIKYYVNIDTLSDWEKAEELVKTLRR